MDEYQKLVIKRWIIKAENDLRAAKNLLAVEPPVTDVICFHSQQCIEKSLKSFLTLVDHHVEKTHFLPKLIKYCSQYDKDFIQFMEIAETMTEYAVLSRYPDDWREIEMEEALEAVQHAQTVLSFVHSKLGEIFQ